MQIDINQQCHGFIQSEGTRRCKEISGCAAAAALCNVAAAAKTFVARAEEVATVYNNGIAGDISSLNPVAWYRLEEGSGTTVINSGTGGNNLTRTGATYSTDVPG